MKMFFFTEGEKNKTGNYMFIFQGNQRLKLRGFRKVKFLKIVQR